MSSPSVVRLRNYVKIPRARRVPLNRKAIFLRDDHSCQYCTRPAENVDHVIPRSQGGEHKWDNVVASCRRCNSKKGGRTPEQACMHLIRRPRKPRRNPVVTLRLGEARYRTWKAFLDDAYWTVELRD